jgi:hypothetical protein
MGRAGDPVPVLANWINGHDFLALLRLCRQDLALDRRTSKDEDDVTREKGG